MTALQSFAQTNLQSIQLAGSLHFVTNAQPPQLTWFTNTFSANSTNVMLSVNPVKYQGLFYTGDSITISNSLTSRIEVYDYRWKPITNASAPLSLTGLATGHYWVQCDGTSGGYGDRVQFTVLPLASSNNLHISVGEQAVSGDATGSTSNRQLRVRAGWIRAQEAWSTIMSNGAYTWTAPDNVMGEYTNGPLAVPLRVLNIEFGHGTNSNYPVWEWTNSAAQYVVDVANTCSNAAIKYTTNFVYEILNEPSSELAGTFGTNDWMPIAAQAVSAAVQAVRSVCPSCQTWAPAQSGNQSASDASPSVTNAVYQPYFANVNALTWHEGGSLYGPVDQPPTVYSLVGWWSGIYPTKSMIVSEAYPYSPDPLGRTNAWALDVASGGGTASANKTWKNMMMRYSKELVQWKAAGVSQVLQWLGAVCCGYPVNPPTAFDGSDYYAWYGNPLSGQGPNPTLDYQLMWDYWLRGATPLTNVAAGGLHYFEFQMPGGNTNTILWADEGAGYATNIGAYVSDVYSQKWPSLTITEEPVMAWGWPTAVVNSPPLVPANRLAPWQGNVGVPGGIPVRSTIYTTMVAGASESAIQGALNSCPSNQVVLLPAGTNTIASGLVIPSYVTLRGSGTNTVLYNTSSGSGVIQFGGQVNPQEGSKVSITSGYNQGSTSIVMASTSGITLGTMLQITEQDDWTNYGVTNYGDGAYCDYCDNGWAGQLDAGQLVSVTGVSGTTVTFTPPLFMQYYASQNPNATPYNPGCQWAGVENLMIYANKIVGGGDGAANIFGNGISYCWVKGVEGNFTDHDHIHWWFAYRCEARDNYFHDGFYHGPGQDATVFLGLKSTGCLFENNILYRLHGSFIIEEGAAGNVFAYNYSVGDYLDPAEGDSWLINDFVEHGTHTMFNLYEGNIGVLYRPDTTHGSASDETLLRNWMTGAGVAIPPFSARGALTNSAAVQQTADNVGGFSIDCTSPYFNLVGNIAGSISSLSNNPAYIDVCVNAGAYGNSTSFTCYRFGYSDDNGNDSLSIGSNTFNTAVFTGNYDFKTASQHWRTNNTASSTLTNTIPTSYYMANAPACFTNWNGQSFTWPPLDPANTNTFTVNSIPAGYRFNQGRPIP